MPMVELSWCRPSSTGVNEIELLPVSKHLAHVNFVVSKNDHVWTARTWLIVSQQHGPIIVPAFYPSKACCRSTRWLQFK